MVVQAPPASDLLRIRLLGELELRRGDTLLSLPPSRRTRALLGYLVATAAPQSRATLCDLLWDGPDDPRASLRWSLTKLRALVDDARGQRLVADRERVGFDAQHCEVDTQRVHALLRGGLEAAPVAVLEQAAACLQGEFLDGLDLPACYRFHHWCLAERERLGGLRRAVLGMLVARLEADPVRALPYGHAMVAADPLTEAPHTTLVRLLAAAGRYPEAERHYTWARALLRREMALPDGGPLDETIHRVRREQREHGDPGVAGPCARAPTPAAAPEPARRAGPPACAATSAATSAEAAPALPPLVGRELECQAIAQAVAGTLSARLLLFAGEPGIGKTRMLDHLAQTAAAAGQRVIRARCFEAETVRPYGLWLDALRGVPVDGVAAATLALAAPLLGGGSGMAGRAGSGGGAAAGVAGQVASPVAGDPDGRAPGGNRERLVDAAAGLLRSLATRQPVVVLIDDLQWIDEASAAVLHFLVRTLAAVPVVFAATARTGEIDDHARAKGLLQSLAREGGLLRRDLDPLDAAEARTLLATAPLDVDEALRLTGGNPLYLIELGRAAQRAAPGTGGSPGIACNPDGPGPAVDSGDPLLGQPRTLEALIDARLGELDDPDRDLLAWAASFGSELRPDLLADAAGVPVAEVLARLARLTRRGLVAPIGHGHFDFAHGLVRQGAYRALSSPHRRAIHRQIARTLLTASASDPGLHGQTAHHAALAGDLTAAARAGLAAGEHCLRVYANAQATQAAERGLAQLAELAPDAERVRLEIGLLRLQVAAAAGAGAGGRRLPALAERIEQATLAAQALSLHADAAAGWEILAYWRQQASDTRSTEQATLAAERMTRRADDTTRCLQLANSARCLLDIEADPARGRALLAEAAALADELGQEVMEIDWARALVARADGELERAAAALAHAVALARLTDNHWREYECTVWQAVVALERRRLPEVLAHVEAITAAAARMGEPGAPFAQALGALARLQARDDSARPLLDAGLDALRALDDQAHLAYALNEAAALALAAGRTGAARASAGEALQAARTVRRPTEVAVALARLACATPDPDLAAQWLSQVPGADLSDRAAAAVAEAGRHLASRGVSTITPTGAP